MTKSRAALLPFLLGTLLFATAEPLPAVEPAAATNPLAPLAALAGRWGGTIEWTNGTTTDGYVVYEWGLNQKILRVKTHVKTTEGSRQIYEGMIGWHPEKKQIVVLIFGLGGVFYQGVVEPAADGFDFAWDSHSSQGTSHYRQTLRFLDADRYRWRAFRKADVAWEPLMKECTYFRQETE